MTRRNVRTGGSQGTRVIRTGWWPDHILGVLLTGQWLTSRRAQPGQDERISTGQPRQGPRDLVHRASVNSAVPGAGWSSIVPEIVCCVM